MDALTIGQVAKQAGVGVETVRFYEREGLIAEPDRRPSGYRQYPPDAVQRIRFIRHAKELGFSLKEISELLSLRVDPDSTCADVRQRARDKIADIEEKMASLARMKAALERLVTKCRGKGPTTECPILEEIDREEDGDADS
ncbi:MAG: MerR family DNA-binding protein [Planctomycetes bacterium]|nr:MerR family DNA-binding protein [Planctomycetota bacterium]